MLLLSSVSVSPWGPHPASVLVALRFPVGESLRVEEFEEVFLELGSKNTDYEHEGETKPEDVGQPDTRRDPCIVQKAEGRDEEEVVR